VGDWVEVLYEYGPGTCSDGGVGTVAAIETTEEGKIYCTVGYVLDKRIETGIDSSRITVTITSMPYKDTTPTKRARREPVVIVEEEDVSRKVVPPDRTPLQWLEYGLKSRTHEKRGWLRDKLLFYDLMEPNREALWKRILSDYKCQLAAIEGMRLALGDNFKDPRDHKGHSGEGGKFVSTKKESQRDIPKNMWTIPYLLHAYDVKRSNFQNKRRDDKKGKAAVIKKRGGMSKGECVITNRAAAKRVYSPKFFFSRTKALALTVPRLKPEFYNDPTIPILRCPEWQQYMIRVMTLARFEPI
jgi:hypothetical protein